MWIDTCVNVILRTITTRKLSIPRVPLFASLLLRMDLSEQPSSGAAQRRRQRRLRSWLRHERMAVAVALAESTHHSSRGQTNARAGVWGREMNCTATIQDPPTHPSRSSSSCRSKKSRTGSLRWPGRRSGICGAPCSRSSMQSLRCRFSAVLRRRWWNSCRTSYASSARPRLLQSNLSQCPRSCPVMSLANHCSRYVAGGTAGGTSLQRIVEQNVAIPVLGGGGRLAGLQGFLPAQSSAAPQFSEKRFSERIVEQIAHISGGDLRVSRPVQGSPASSSFVSPAGSDDDANEPGEGFFFFFALFPTLKKVRRSPGTRVPGDVSSSTLSAHQIAPAGRLCFGARMSAPRWLTTTGVRGCVWTLRGVRTGRTWTLGTHSGARPGSTEVPQIQFIDFMVVDGGFWRTLFFWICSRCSHLEIWCIIPPRPCIWQLFRRCLGAACGLRR